LKISLIKCTSYDTNEVAAAVDKAIGLIGGMNEFIKPGEKILIKPNMLGARQPERAVTTHPEVVRAVIRQVKNTGASPLVGDSPGGAVKGVERVWVETGIKKVCREESVPLINFETSGSVEKPITHPLLDKIHTAKITDEVDGIINLPKLKTHSVVIYTGAIKNLYGCIPGLRKAEYHKIVPYPYEFSQLLNEIYLLIKPKIRLNLVDGVMGMEGNGPNSGDIRKLDMIIAGQNALDVDSTITKILGLKPSLAKTVYYLAPEIENKNPELVGDSPGCFNVSKFKFPSNWYMNIIPKWLINTLGKYVWLKPMIIPEVCTACMLCVNSCPVKAIKKEGKNKPAVDPKECISCLCCHELCPSKAISLKKSLLARFMIR
jgi:uncharacterized protein (DUF362 family)/NAD-dependent dihydropyrimidine dehydrogenase PreA subunit